MPCCPMVEDLMLYGVSGTLLVSMAENSAGGNMPFGFFSKLKTLRISNVGDLISLPKECLSLDIRDHKLMNTSRLTISNSLLSLEFTHCHNLRSLFGGLEHRTALENLVIWNCKELDISSREDIEHEHCYCPKLNSLPDGFHKLNNLIQLGIYHCEGLTNRCPGPTGEDWLKIQHIPYVTVEPRVSTEESISPAPFYTLCSLFLINFSRTPIKELPNSITKLQHLRTLELHACHRLRGCLLGSKNLPISGDLMLVNVGSFEIKINEAKEANLSSKHALMELHLEGDLDEPFTSIQHDEATLEGLKPHHNLKRLMVPCHRGEKLPSWAVNDNLCTTFLNLIEVELSGFIRCQQVPSFSQLTSLKCLLS
ncbi:hypothetical protein Cgig2_005230 [Carnegiea gigantea]|uniref:R13L1/DRL21-like LRR repeat region domain-containing protein n=1 Tax=Carnegiea gigantea TaxID=171969 RepID=A0A9Q1QCE8_9CARY|nr:hypothetical protein Cgig2_005230 [Carnegiea gigantea]